MKCAVVFLLALSVASLGSAQTAYDLLLKERSLTGQSVKVGCLVHARAVRANRVRSVVVGHDEDNVRIMLSHIPSSFLRVRKGLPYTSPSSVQAVICAWSAFPTRLAIKTLSSLFLAPRIPLYDSSRFSFTTKWL